MHFYCVLMWLLWFRKSISIVFYCGYCGSEKGSLLCSTVPTVVQKRWFTTPGTTGHSSFYKVFYVVLLCVLLCLCGSKKSISIVFYCGYYGSKRYSYCVLRWLLWFKKEAFLLCSAVAIRLRWDKLWFKNLQTLITTRSSGILWHIFIGKSCHDQR